MKRAIALIRRIVDDISYLGYLAMLCMMMLTVVDVTLRFFGHPIMGSMEITVALMVCVVFFGMGRCTLQNVHLKVELFKKFPILDKINSIITMILCFVIGWQCVVQGGKAMDLQSASQLLRIPKYPFLYVAACGFFLVAVALLITLISGNGDAKTGDEEESS